MWRTGAWVAVLAALVVAAVLLLAVAEAYGANDPPVLVPWTRIGGIALGESKAHVERQYGSEGHGYHVLNRGGGILQGYYRLHGGSVFVTFQGGRVNELDFTTRYYRTTGGFGVGSLIPLGACYRTAAGLCAHRWRGFIWNPRLRENPCGCWVKVGFGAQSLPVTTKNFLKPWFIIYVRQGHVARFYFTLKYID